MGQPKGDRTGEVVDTTRQAVLCVPYVEVKMIVLARFFLSYV